MKVIYSGPSPLSFHSAPSGMNYVFVPGVAKAIGAEDEEYFKEKCNSTIPGNPWKIETLAETVAKNAADKVVDVIDSKLGKGSRVKGGNK